MVDLDRLRRRLEHESPAPAPPGQTPAAVLVPIVADPADVAPAGGSYLLLTRRTDGLTNHRGEIAFPGGRLEPGETALEAALREANEELGVVSSEVDVLGRLPGLGTNLSRFWIVPVVGVLGPGLRERLVANPAEVAEVLEVPLEGLASAAARRDQRFIRGTRMVIAPAYDVGSTTIWGATARIISELLAVLAD